MIATWKNLAIAGGAAAMGVGGFAGICYLMIEPKTGVLELAVNEPGSEVQVLDHDGKVESTHKAEKSALNIPLSPGKHQLHIKKEGFAPFSEEVEIKAGSRKTVSAKLSAAGEGHSLVHAGPGGRVADAALEFVEIFNGRDLTGWERLGPVGAWTIDPEKRSLTASGSGGLGWLLTKEEYGDFLLQLEYQLTPGSNSGIALLADPKDEHHLEVQLANLDFYPSGALWTSPANKEHGGYVAPQTLAREEPNNTWHRLNLELRDQKIRVTINGILVSQFDLNELSKSPGTHQALKRAKGRIGLQSQANVVRFRNIKVAALDSASNLAKTTDHSVTPKSAVQVTSPLAAAAKTDDSWFACGEFWNLKDGELSGSSVNKKLGFNTFYYSNKKYADFELTCQAKLLRGNSGIQIRSEVEDAKLAMMKGPQADMMRGYWGSLYGERMAGVMQEAPGRFEDEVIKVNEFNDLSIRCVGQRVTVKINGKISVDHEFLDLPLTGLIGFQLGHGETEVAFRNIRITELAKSATGSDAPKMPEKVQVRRTAIDVGSPLVGAAAKPADSWGAYGDFWTLKDGELAGTSINKKLGFNTFYYDKKIYKNFELKCQAKLLRGNSGIQFRSEMDDAKLAIMKGPQADMERGYWGSLYGERMSGVMQAAPERFEHEAVKAEDFNEMHLRCVGKHITLKINGKTSIDREFPEIPASGLIGFQLGHGETDVVFRNIQITDLGDMPDPPQMTEREKPRTAIEVPSPLVGATTKPPEAWGAYGDFWSLKEGELSGSSVDKRLGFNTFYYGKKTYGDFELTCQAKLLRGNSGIQVRSTVEDAKLGIMKGPQADMERGAWGSLYGERMTGVMQAAPRRFEDETIKANDFNDISIRCVGKRITLKINGKTAIDRNFPEIAATGLIGFQLGHGETEVVFRNIQVTELNK